ncbi:MAG: CoA-binding protein [Candidatus Eremiobacteraeota bacterium]|nr:CoA-binding protein [Candidatus Eremiobacteraeota bacterium]MBV8499885.1 CoA-binding protein [Candidatus Eremiobacteraeota bacterium]
MGSRAGDAVGRSGRGPGDVILTTPAQRRELLQQIGSVAMVGASANPLRPSYTVFSYLRTQSDYDVTPINPTVEQIDGVRAFPSLDAYARERGIPDVVDVFRKPSEVLGVVREAIALGVPAIWFQYGVVHPEAIALADEAGISVVVDRCLKVEHARFRGGLSMNGLNSGIITSRRPRH